MDKKKIEDDVNRILESFKKSIADEDEIDFYENDLGKNMLREDVSFSYEDEEFRELFLRNAKNSNENFILAKKADWN